MKCKFVSAAVSRSVIVIFLQVHIHLENSNQKKQKTNVWDSSAAKKQGIELVLWQAYAKATQLLLLIQIREHNWWHPDLRFSHLL